MILLSLNVVIHHQKDINNIYSGATRRIFIHSSGGKYNAKDIYVSSRVIDENKYFSTVVSFLTYMSKINLKKNFAPGMLNHKGPPMNI